MAQKAVASKHADPAAVTAEAAPAPAAAAPARRGPVITLTPQAIASIRDDTIRAAKLKEVALRAELANLRGAQRTAMQEKDQAMRKIQGPKSDPALDKLDVDWSQCMSERDTLNRKLDALKLEQAQISRMRDELRGCDLEMENATQLVRQQDRHFVQCRQAVAESSAKRDEILHALVFKSAGEADDEINRLEQKIAAATRKGETNLVRELNKQRAAADKAKRLVTQSYSADDDVIKKKEEFAKAEQALNEAIEKRKAIDEKRNAMRDKVFGNKNFNADFRAVNDQLDALRKKMDTIKEKKRNVQKKADADRTESSGVKDAVAALDEARSRLTQVLKELDEIAETVPHIEVTFPAELRGEIIGRGGATLDQLRADFGVAVEFTPERVNCLTIVGARPDCEDTKAALSEMMKNLELCRKTATVTFDPSIAASLIGSRGSNVERIQNISGAKIRVSSSDGTATIVGTQEAVDTAKAMIEQHIDQSASIEIPFHKDVRDLVLGKAGATVRRIEEESGAKKIRVDRDRGIISAFGSKAAVEKVKALYGELLADFSAAGFTMRVDQRMLGVIIGKGGSTVQEIQSSTGCIVTIADAGTVTLRGSKDAIQNARRKIEDLTRRDEVRIPYNRAVHELLITRPLITADGGASGETVQQEEKNSPIEEVREVSGCDLVTCLRVEGVILIRGRKEQVSQAKKMLEELLDTLRPDTAVVAFPEVLFNHLTRRTGADKLSILDRIKLEFPSVIAIDIVRSTGQITVAGDKPGVTAASEKLQSLFGDAAASIGTFTTTQSGAGAIIGQGGSKIKELERLHKVDINVSKTNLVTVYAHAGKDALATALAEVEKVAKAAR